MHNKIIQTYKGAHRRFFTWKTLSREKSTGPPRSRQNMHYNEQLQDKLTDPIDTHNYCLSLILPLRHEHCSPVLCLHQDLTTSKPCSCWNLSMSRLQLLEEFQEHFIDVKLMNKRICLIFKWILHNMIIVFLILSSPL